MFISVILVDSGEDSTTKEIAFALGNISLDIFLN